MPPATHVGSRYHYPQSTGSSLNNRENILSDTNRAQQHGSCSLYPLVWFKEEDGGIRRE